MIKTISKSLQSIFPLLVIIFIFSRYGFAQDITISHNQPQPPPADINFTLENTLQVGSEAALRLKVTPLEDMHAEISCLLPEGVKLVRENGAMVRPYVYKDRRRFSKQLERRPRKAIVLHVGPLTAGATEEFVFRLIFPAKGKYELIVSVDALAKWGTKEETLSIDIK